MLVEDIVKALSATIVTETELNEEISACYAGDFLSRVISRVPENAVWLTIMANVNVAGVMSLSEIPVVVLCEGVKPDPLLIEKATNEKLCVLRTQLPVFEACCALAAIMQ